MKSTTYGTKKQDGVADGARTHDNRNHNPGLYQLSYSHHKLQIIDEVTFYLVSAKFSPSFCRFFG